MVIIRYTYHCEIATSQKIAYLPNYGPQTTFVLRLTLYAVQLEIARTAYTTCR